MGLVHLLRCGSAPLAAGCHNSSKTPKLRRKQVMADSCPVWPFRKLVIICMSFPSRIIGILAACPYHRRAGGVTTGFIRAQTAPAYKAPNRAAFNLPLENASTSSPIALVWMARKTLSPYALNGKLLLKL